MLTNSLPQTGERFLPYESGQNRYEHLHRYLVCTKFVRGKDVLDIASGEGYGAAMMARSARHVTGVDISAEAVAHGRRSYYHPNLRFLVGDCAAIPIADASVDVVTSFETLEHHAEHDGMMAEVRRVLRPDGTLIISSPNKLVYSDEVGFTNPFHVRELYFDEFSELCRRYFSHVQMYGQFMGAASFVLPLGDALTTAITSYGSTSSGDVQRGLAGPKLPMYFVAVCSNVPARAKTGLDSLFLDIDEDFFGQLTRPQVQRIVRVEQQHWVGESKAVALPGAGAPSSRGSLPQRLASTVRSLEAVSKQAAQLHEETATVRAAYFDIKGQSDTRLLESEQRVARLEAELREGAEQLATLRAQLDAERSATARSIELSVARNQSVIAFNTSLWRTSSSVKHWRMVASVLSAELEETTAALLTARAQLNGVFGLRTIGVVKALRKIKAKMSGAPRNGPS